MLVQNTVGLIDVRSCMAIHRNGAPVLLTMADYYGTLAAARCLGRAGVSVTMADPSFVATARWSRFVDRRLRCPPVLDPKAFIAWLLEFGRRERGFVLTPTSDDMAWLFSLHRDALAHWFRLYQPPVETIVRLLDKRKLTEAAKTVGLDIPRTWFPADDAELAEVAREAHFPVLLKPVTQVLFEKRCKGERVLESSALAERFHGFDAACYCPELLRSDPSITRPMVQEFYSEAAQSIYNLSGFVDHTGELFAARAGVKVLQRPRRLGIGLCFEEAEVHPELVAGVKALCRSVGYFGVFEVEFIQFDGRFLVIDFNPRFYSQMAFDVDRGLPLPLMIYNAALGDWAAVERLVHKANAPIRNERRVYTSRFVLEVMLRAQRLSGALSRNEVYGWRRWFAAHRAAWTDAVIDRGDILPAIVDVANTLFAYARHPRGFFRHMVLNQ